MQSEPVDGHELLGADGAAGYLSQLRAEFRPTNATEEILLKVLASSAAGLDFARACENAILRESVRRVAALAVPGAVEPESPHHTDCMLAAAMTGDVLDRQIRFRRSHQGALFGALKALTEIRTAQPQSLRTPMADEFASEDHCRAYLERMLRASEFRCPTCGDQRGFWLANRRRRECAGCRRQLGPRTGTVMRNSRLPLTNWFSAIKAIVERPNIPVADLAQQIGVHRLATVRGMATKIRVALVSTNATQLLAGLNVYFRRSEEGYLNCVSLSQKNSPREK
jgi:hypothetical protein